METSTKWLIGLSVVVGAIIVAAVVAEASPAQASQQPAPSPSSPQTLIQGHRYTATFSCPTYITQPIVPSLRVYVVSAVAPNGRWTIVFDYVGPTGPLADSAIWAGAPGSSGCTFQMQDMGATPPLGVLPLMPGYNGAILVHTSAPYQGTIGGVSVQPVGGSGNLQPVINSVTSTDQSVIQNLTANGASGVSLGILKAGTTTLTFQWLDSGGNPQWSTLVVTLVNP